MVLTPALDEFTCLLTRIIMIYSRIMRLGLALTVNSVMRLTIFSVFVCACSQVVPLPTPEEVRAAGSLPVADFPSDHLALTADFKWLD